MNIVLKVTDAAVFAGKTQLVEPTSFDLAAGRVLTILGETGSGKSLLVQAVAGLLPTGLSATGFTEVGGKSFDLTAPTSLRPVWGRTLGILPQEPWLALDPTMRALDQVAEGHRLVRDLEPEAARLAARSDLVALGVGDAERKLPGELSGGMAQRVAFAAARAGGARIVIADEPTKGLDATRRNDVIALLMKEVEAGGSVLVITHDLALAKQMGGDIAVVLQGRVIERGDAGTVLTNPSHAYTKRLIAADPANWIAPTTHEQQGEHILVAEGVSKARGGRLLFSGQSLRVRRGEIIGLSGASGSGKSSLGDILLGLIKPDEGTITRLPGAERHRFQKIYQDPPSAFPARITIGQNLSDLIRRHSLDNISLPPLMKRLGLSKDLLGRLPAEVSGGELQRFSIARAMLLDPVFLFADEPTSRLDPITQQETVALLVELARERSCAVLFVSHDKALIEKTCDNIVEIAHSGGK